MAFAARTARRLPGFQFPTCPSHAPPRVEPPERAEEKLRRASEPIELLASNGPRAIGNPLAALEAKELMRRLADCLSRLPAAWRAVLALRDAEERSYEQIAEVLHVELGTVRSRLARARASLKNCVEGKAA